MSAFDLILEQIAALRARMDRERTTLRLGTVQSSGTVLLTDGAEVTPAARMVATETGDIVLAAQHNRRAYVLGKPPAAPTDRTHFQVYSAGTTDASGFLTVSHTAPFTPRAALLTNLAPGGSFAVPWGADTFTSTTARTRWMHANTAGPFASTSIGEFASLYVE